MCIVFKKISISRLFEIDLSSYADTEKRDDAYSSAVDLKLNLNFVGIYLTIITVWYRENCNIVVSITLSILACACCL